MNKYIVLAIALLTVFAGNAFAQYPEWRHSGSLYILTTPEGANLPATAAVENFPLLVRLNQEWFDFSQAKANGEDVRFTAEEKPLAYQIEEWNAAKGCACIWVRIPAIKGNAHQEIKMHWGKAGAKSESNGGAVFNKSNGYLSVFHMDASVKDEVGTLVAEDSGTTTASGMIGKARRFSGTPITCGEEVATYPAGNDPHTSELWLRAEDLKVGGLLRWGVNRPNGIVQMIFGRPPRIRMDCFYSQAGIRNESLLSLSQWVHVAYVYKPGNARLYINGSLDGVRTGENVSLAIGSPALAQIGAGFVGDIDEVRVSDVARSADWLKLQYENEKPLQTAVGALVSPGNGFSVSPKTIEILEGKSATVTAKAGGAQKLYWILKSDGKETVVAADALAFTFHAGRVAGDQSSILQFKAVYADGTKTIDIPVTIKEAIPEPVFTLQAPAKWDGRETIEIASQITNLSDMQAKDAGELKYDWTVSGAAVIKELAPGKLILKRANKSGTITITATVSNGGKPTAQSIAIEVKEPAKDAWVERKPGKDEKPVDNQFFARNDKDQGTLYYNGKLDQAADAVFVRLYADDKLCKSERQQPKADNSYSFELKLKAGLVRYKVEFGVIRGNTEKILHTAGNLVCGDAYIIEGQSNAVAYNYHDNKQRSDLIDYTSDWIRSYGSNGEAGDDTTNGGWGNAVLTNLKVNGRGGVHFIGVWGMVMAKKLVDDQKIPICIFNGAVGGTRIDQHMPDLTDRYGTTDHAHSIYRNLLRRIVAARLTHGIRGALWHQGEADQGYDGPDNCFGCETYQHYFIDLTAAWKQDYPNLKHYYVYQIWPNACGQGGYGASDKLRDVQRRLSRLYSNLSVMPTLGFPSGQGCHFNLADYEQMGLSMVPLIERDSFGKIFDHSISAPDLQRAYYTSDAKNEIALEFDQPMAWSDALAAQFFLDGKGKQIASGAADGNVIKLKLALPANAKAITYLDDQKWDHKTVLYGQNGIAALTFCAVEIAQAKK